MGNCLPCIQSGAADEDKDYPVPVAAGDGNGPKTMVVVDKNCLAPDPGHKHSRPVRMAQGEECSDN